MIARPWDATPPKSREHRGVHRTYDPADLTPATRGTIRLPRIQAGEEGPYGIRTSGGAEPQQERFAGSAPPAPPAVVGGHPSRCPDARGDSENLVPRLIAKGLGSSSELPLHSSQTSGFAGVSRGIVVDSAGAGSFLAALRCGLAPPDGRVEHLRRADTVRPRWVPRDVAPPVTADGNASKRARVAITIPYSQDKFGEIFRRDGRRVTAPSKKFRTRWRRKTAVDSQSLDT